MKQTALPEPETKEAFLASEGYKKPVFTKHHYYDTRIIPDAVDGMGRPVVEYEYRFRCFKTGEIRRYGTCSPDQGIDAELEIN